jgi:hypothetical protein
MNEFLGEVSVNRKLDWIKAFYHITNCHLLDAKLMYELLQARGYSLDGNPNSLLVAGMLQDRWQELAGKTTYRETLKQGVAIAKDSDGQDGQWTSLAEMATGSFDIAKIGAW